MVCTSAGAPFDAAWLRSVPGAPPAVRLRGGVRARHPLPSSAPPRGGRAARSTSAPSWAGRGAPGPAGRRRAGARPRGPAAGRGGCTAEGRAGRMVDLCAVLGGAGRAGPGGAETGGRGGPRGLRRPGAGAVRRMVELCGVLGGEGRAGPGAPKKGGGAAEAPPGGGRRRAGTARRMVAICGVLGGGRRVGPGAPKKRRGAHSAPEKDRAARRPLRRRGPSSPARWGSKCRPVSRRSVRPLGAPGTRRAPLCWARALGRCLRRA